jgi:pyruvate,water dikinase
LTKGLPSQERVVAETHLKGKRFMGKPTSRGVIDNVEVVVMPKLDLKANVRGKVLVAEATDPGWTVLFPLIKGIIIEKGGVLSHASIVAREIGIPCLIMPDATKILSNGNLIKLNAIKGVVKIV